MKFEQHVAEMRGVYAAIFTPFDASNEVNFDMLTQIANFQMENGINGFFVCGATGEGLLLSFEERIEVVSHMVETCRGRATIIAHVGHPSTDVASRLAEASAAVGAHWVASVGPICHGMSLQGAIRHYDQISSATDLPFMIYAQDGQIDPIRDMAFFRLPNVCGLKYTGSNFYSAQQLARNVDRPMARMSGFDEQFVAGQAFGFAGGIGSTYNFAPQLYAEIYRRYHLGEIDAAAQIQADINRVTYEMVQYENWSYRKAIMKYIGFDCGAARSPYAPLTAEQEMLFFGRLDRLGVLARNGAIDPFGGAQAE